MILIVIALGILSIVGLQKKEISLSEWLNKETTVAVNGIFALLIFFSHSSQYLTLDNCLLNRLYVYFHSAHSQLVVTSFLTFSGYGVMESIKNKGETYLRLFPKKRILKTLVHFDLAIILFLISNYFFIGNSYSIKNITLSFIGWTAVGNSNWYIFSILMMYTCTWISGELLSLNYKKIPLSVTVLSVCYIILMWFAKMPMRFSSTILCYSLGMFASLYKEEAYAMIEKKKHIVLVGSILLLILTLPMREYLLIMNVHSIAFMTIVLLILRYIKIGNRVLSWIGKMSFSIYILQRLPMNAIETFHFEWYIFVPMCLLITIIISFLFEKVLTFADKELIKI